MFFGEFLTVGRDSLYSTWPIDRNINNVGGLVSYSQWRIAKIKCHREIRIVSPSIYFHLISSLVTSPVIQAVFHFNSHTFFSVHFFAIFYSPRSSGDSKAVECNAQNFIQRTSFEQLSMASMQSTWNAIRQMMTSRSYVVQFYICRLFRNNNCLSHYIVVIVVVAVTVILHRRIIKCCTWKQREAITLSLVFGKSVFAVAIRVFIRHLSTRFKERSSVRKKKWRVGFWKVELLCAQLLCSGRGTWAQELDSNAYAISTCHNLARRIDCQPSSSCNWDTLLTRKSLNCKICNHCNARRH